MRYGGLSALALVLAATSPARAQVHPTPQDAAVLTQPTLSQVSGATTPAGCGDASSSATAAAPACSLGSAWGAADPAADSTLQARSHEYSDFCDRPEGHAARDAYHAAQASSEATITSDDDATAAELVAKPEFTAVKDLLPSSAIADHSRGNSGEEMWNVLVGSDDCAQKYGMGLLGATFGDSSSLAASDARYAAVQAQCATPAEPDPASCNVSDTDLAACVQRGSASCVPASCDAYNGNPQALRSCQDTAAAHVSDCRSEAERQCRFNYASQCNQERSRRFAEREAHWRSDQRRYERCAERARAAFDRRQEQADAARRRQEGDACVAHRRDVITSHQPAGEYTLLKSDASVLIAGYREIMASGGRRSAYDECVHRTLGHGAALCRILEDHMSRQLTHLRETFYPPARVARAQALIDQLKTRYESFINSSVSNAGERRKMLHRLHAIELVVPQTYREIKEARDGIAYYNCVNANNRLPRGTECHPGTIVIGADFMQVLDQPGGEERVFSMLAHEMGHGVSLTASPHATDPSFRNLAECLATRQNYDRFAADNQTTLRDEGVADWLSSKITAGYLADQPPAQREGAFRRMVSGMTCTLVGTEDRCRGDGVNYAYPPPEWAAQPAPAHPSTTIHTRADRPPAQSCATYSNARLCEPAVSADSSSPAGPDCCSPESQSLLRSCLTVHDHPINPDRFSLYAVDPATRSALGCAAPAAGASASPANNGACSL